MPAAAQRKARKRTVEPRARRLTALRASLRHSEYDAILITNPADIFYLSGFSGEDSYVLVTARKSIVLSDSRFEEELGPIRSKWSVVIRNGPINEAAGALIRDVDVRSVAVQAEHLSVSTRRSLAKAVGASRLKDTTGVLASLRTIKDDAEVRAIRKAVQVQEQALSATLDQIGTGWEEIEIAALLEYELKSRGASGLSFETNVSAHANGSKPHYRPGSVATARGKPLLIDWGAKSGGYCADMTRTFSFGSWPTVLRDVYKIVLEAQESAIAGVRPGISCSQLDGLARSVIEKAGYGKQFGHALGHGIGLDVHESPRVGKEIHTPLEPGMVITIEPGVYLPGVGGVRIEDDILVTARGGRNLCTLPKDLNWATL